MGYRSPNAQNSHIPSAGLSSLRRTGLSVLIKTQLGPLLIYVAMNFLNFSLDPSSIIVTSHLQQRQPHWVQFSKKASFFHPEASDHYSVCYELTGTSQAHKDGTM